MSDWCYVAAHEQVKFITLLSSEGREGESLCRIVFHCGHEMMASAIVSDGEGLVILMTEQWPGVCEDCILRPIERKKE